MIRKHLTYANVIATLALFLALGGSSYALTVGTKSIKNNSVRSVDVRNGTLRDRDVRRGALGGRAINERALGTVFSASTIRGTITTVTTGNNNVVAQCPGNYRVISGGGAVIGNGSLASSRPDPGAGGALTSPGWRAIRAGGGGQVRAYAICVAE